MSLKDLNYLFQVIQWIHVSHKSEIAPPVKEGIDQVFIFVWLCDKSNDFGFVPREDSDQPWHPASLI